MSFGISGTVKNVSTPIGNATYLEIFIAFDGEEDLPSDVTSIQITSPSGLLPYDVGDFTFYTYPTFVQFFKRVYNDQPEVGEYTFEVTLGGITKQTTDTQGVLETINLPDPSSITPADGYSVSAGDINFSWATIGDNYFYGIKIKDDSDIFVYRTIPFVQNGTSGMFTMVPGIYQWRLEIADHDNYKLIDNRVQSVFRTITIT